MFFQSVILVLIIQYQDKHTYNLQNIKVCLFKNFHYLFLDLSSVRTALNMLAKVGVTVSFSGIYIWSAELFPTVVRNVGIGSASTVSRISGMGAPYIGGPLVCCIVIFC